MRPPKPVWWTGSWAISSGRSPRTRCSPRSHPAMPGRLWRWLRRPAPHPIRRRSWPSCGRWGKQSPAPPDLRIGAFVARGTAGAQACDRRRGCWQPLGLGTQARNFLFVVIDHRRVARIAGDRGSVRGAARRAAGVCARRCAERAKPLTDAQQAGLEAEISRMAGKKAKLNFPSIRR